METIFKKLFDFVEVFFMGLGWGIGFIVGAYIMTFLILYFLFKLDDKIYD